MTGLMVWFGVTAALLSLWIIGAIALDELRDRWNR